MILMPLYGSTFEQVQSIDDLSYEVYKQLNNKIFETIEEDLEMFQVILGNESVPYLSTKLNNLIREYIGMGRAKKGTFTLSTW